MQSPPNHTSTTRQEIEANFSVVKSTLERLESGLLMPDFQTSYRFISDNINRTVSYLQNEIRNLISQATYFESIWVGLQPFLYEKGPKAIFTYRDNVRKFSDRSRKI